MSEEYSDDWSGFSEVREVEPFPTVADGLDGCGFRWTRAIDFHLVQATIPTFESNPLEEVDDFLPEFKIEADVEKIAEGSGRSADELSVHFLVRDRSLNHFAKLDSFDLDDLPETFGVQEGVLEQLCGVRGLDFGMVVSPKPGIEDQPGLASSPGQIVAQKFFHLGIPSAPASGFPVTFEHPEQFEAGVSKDAVWYVRWLKAEKMSDPNAPAEEVLRVVYNKNCSDKLYRIPENDPSGRLFWSEIAVEVFLEIASVLLANQDVENPPEGAEGFYPTVFRTVSRITDRPIEKIREEFLHSDPSAVSRLRSSLHSFFKITNNIERAKFGR